MESTTLQYQDQTAKAGHHRLVDAMLLMGHLQTNADVNADENIRHQGLLTLTKAGNSLGMPPQGRRAAGPPSATTPPLGRNALHAKNSLYTTVAKFPKLIPR